MGCRGGDNLLHGSMGAECMGKHRAACAQGRQPGCMSAVACVPVTCECRCAQACAFPKCVPRTVSACGSCWRTGSTRAHGQAAGTHLRTGVSTRRQVRGEQNLRLNAPQPGESARRKAGEGKRERRRVGGRCWHLSTSTDERSGTCRCACSKGPPRRPGPPTPLRTYTSPRCRSQTGLCHLLIPRLSGPHPAQHPTRARSRARYRRSLALNLCSGQDVSVVLSFPSQCQPHEVFAH